MKCDFLNYKKVNLQFDIIKTTIVYGQSGTIFYVLNLNVKSLNVSVKNENCHIVFEVKKIINVLDLWLFLWDILTVCKCTMAMLLFDDTIVYWYVIDYQGSRSLHMTKSLL